VEDFAGARVFGACACVRGGWQQHQQRQQQETMAESGKRTTRERACPMSSLRLHRTRRCRRRPLVCTYSVPVSRSSTLATPSRAPSTGPDPQPSTTSALLQPPGPRASPNIVTSPRRRPPRVAMAETPTATFFSLASHPYQISPLGDDEEIRGLVRRPPRCGLVCAATTLPTSEIPVTSRGGVAWGLRNCLVLPHVAVWQRSGVSHCADCSCNRPWR
jgi:hypothetical protein